ncbi:ComF family protein [uncultured Xylophilus sp.]|uniref:ComF family protein n=1 Tax=uncultured Xylophilus sp. TaxID=296832 RepID=UPI0025D281F0|nr:ComF family protein [uncultured Xylophilus sp.]
MFRSLLARAGSAVAALPGRCMVCAAWPARPLCDPCAGRFAAPVPRCQRCALPLAGGATTCGACLRDPPPLDRCLAAVDYGFPWAQCIADFKFHGRPGMARPLALLMRSTPWAEPEIDTADILVPMPQSLHRLRARGFNQAALLARSLARRRTDDTLLLRLHDGAVQHTLGRRARFEAMRDAFAVEPLHVARLAGRRVLLVDDVMTTGASLHAAARVLRQAGAVRVAALVLARTA